MIRPRHLLIVLVMALVLVGCTEAAPTPHPTALVPTIAPEPSLNPDGDVAHGAALFVQWQCAHCHGGSAQGRLGSSLAGTTQDEADFTTAIRQTRPPKPAFSEGELSAADVKDIYVWLQTLEPLGEQTVSLDDGQILGIQLYTDSGCDSCHGAFAQGSTDAPVLADYQSDDDAFLEALESTAGDITEHSLETLDPALMRRLHGWLQEGANLENGC